MKNTLPKPLSAALHARDATQVAQTLSHAINASPGAPWIPRAPDMLTWLLQDQGALPVENPLSPRAKWTASPAQAEKIFRELWPVLHPLFATHKGGLEKVWQSLGDWARSQPISTEHSHSTGEACARIFLDTLPSMDRSAGQMALDALCEALRVRHAPRQAFIEALTTAAAMQALSAAKVGLRPVDLVIDEAPALFLDGNVPATPEQSVRMQQQQARLQRVLAHPSGVASVVRLDLNPVGPFGTLLNGFGDTPARATVVAKALLPAFRARRSPHADKLASLLAWHDFEGMIASLDPAIATEFWQHHDWFTPPEGWSKACDVLVRTPASMALHALVDLDTPLSDAVGTVERATTFLQSQLAHPKLCALSEWTDVLRDVHKAWTDRAAYPDFAQDSLDHVAAMTPASREDMHQRLRLLFANPFLDEIRGALLARKVPVKTSAATLLVATSGQEPVFKPSRQPRR